MDDFVELFDESDLKELQLEPIKKKEVTKIVQAISISKPYSKTTRVLNDIRAKIYIPQETAKQLVKMMLKN